MFIIASVVFLIVGIWRGSIVFWQMYKRPKVAAEIQSIELKSGYPPFKNKKYRFARVKYQFNEHRFENEEIVLKSKAKESETVLCYVDPENPKDITQFAPKKDAIPVAIVILLGILFMIIHFIAMSALND